MLSRLYGTAFADEKALNAYLKQLVAHEEALALHSLNPKYADIVISPELPLRVLGKVMSK